MKQEIYKYCNTCEKKVSYHYDHVNHWKNLAITVFSLGLWLPMWLLMTFKPTKICDECNEPIWDIK